MSNTPRSFVGSSSFQVTGMTCGHCVHAVITEVGKVSGVQSVAVDLPTGVVTVSTTGPVDRADIAAAVDEAGYTLQP
jgi:copper ion binding protein